MWKESTLKEKILWLYVVLMPFTGMAYFQFGGKRVGYCDFILAILAAVFFAGYLKGRTSFQMRPLWLPILAMLVLFSVSIFNSVNIFHSFAEMAGLLSLVMLFLMVISIISDFNKMRNLLIVYLFISTFISIVSLFYLGLSFVNSDMVGSKLLFYKTLESMTHHFPRIKGPLETPNMMLMYLHTAFIAGMMLLLSEKRFKIRTLFHACIGIIIAASILTGSRRFTGLLLTIFLILCIFGKGVFTNFIKYAVFSAFIVFFAASFIASVWVVAPIRVQNDTVGKNISVKANYKYSLHFIQPIVSINMFKKHPLIGIGIGTYNSHFKDNVDWKWLGSSFGFEAYPEYVEPVEKKELNFDPHSVFLGALAETGLIGFAGLMCFLAAYAHLLIRRFKMSTRGSLEKVISGCVLAGFAGFLLNGLVTDILSMRHFWLMMALGIVSIGRKDA